MGYLILVALTSGASFLAECIGFSIMIIILMKAKHQNTNIIIINGLIQIINFCKSFLIIISLLPWSGNQLFLENHRDAVRRFERHSHDQGLFHNSHKVYADYWGHLKRFAPCPHSSGLSNVLLEARVHFHIQQMHLDILHSFDH